MRQKSFFASALIAILLYASPSFALILLDEVMSKEVQQKTGVANLNPNQKQILEAWLNQTFELKPKPSSEQGAELLLSINIDGGKQLQLSDGSLWEVAPRDVTQSSVWITPFPIRITASNDPNYPSLLINKISGVSVKARRIPSNGSAQTPPPPANTQHP